MAEGPIPFSAIDRFARRYRIESLDEFDHFAGIIRAMDAELRSMRSAQAKRADALREQIEPPKPPKKKPKMLGAP